jgi:hypothetical protein
MGHECDSRQDSHRPKLAGRIEAANAREKLPGWDFGSVFRSLARPGAATNFGDRTALTGNLASRYLPGKSLIRFRDISGKCPGTGYVQFHRKGLGLTGNS